MSEKYTVKIILPSPVLAFSGVAGIMKSEFYRPSVLTKKRVFASKKIFFISYLMFVSSEGRDCTKTKTAPDIVTLAVGTVNNKSIHRKNKNDLGATE